MPETDHGDRVVRLSHDYGRCPRCELVVPLVPDCTTGDPRLGIPPEYSGFLRCGLCARELVDSGRWPLDFRRDCIDCGAAMLAPADVAVVACPRCDAYFLNPANPPDVRARVDAALAERARLAEMVAALDRRIAETLAAFEKAEAQAPFDLYEAIGGGVPAWRPPPPVRVPQEWIDRSRPLPEVFVDAFQQAVRLNGLPRERRVVALRFGLDGQPGLTFREIGLDVGHSPNRAREFVRDVLSKIRTEARRGQPGPEWGPGRRASGILVHIATDVIGDPKDEGAPARMRAFVDQAFPNVRPRVSARLLTELADDSLKLMRIGRQDALARAVAAVRRPR
ncbi:MAG: hypothetical protein ACRDZ4_16990 [Egibacteraceae bacterium]